MIGIKQYKIGQFNSKHSITEDQQFKALVEELGELSEALNTDATDEQVAEELADILFVSRSLAELREINISSELNGTIDENLGKNTATDGQKVTKEVSSDEKLAADYQDEQQPVETSSNSNNFDAGEFAEWLRNQGTPITKDRLYDEFPNFPSQRMIGVTCPIVGNQTAYYKQDLEHAARGGYPID